MLFSKIFSEYSKEAKVLLLSALLEVCCVVVWPAVIVMPSLTVLEMTYTVSGGTLNPTHSLTHAIIKLFYRIEVAESNNV